MLKKLVIREGGNAQREFAERTANDWCGWRCRESCVNGDTYVADLQIEVQHDHVNLC